jgi:hypothetical protein
MLLKTCGYVKRKMQKVNTLKEVEDRNIQFECMAEARKNFVENNLPIPGINKKSERAKANSMPNNRCYPNKLPIHR